MKLISKIIKGNCEVTQFENKSVFTYKIFANLSVVIEFMTDKKSLKIYVKAKSFSKQLMYIEFN